MATDADRLARFEREARSASALNHPNIVTIYEIGGFGTTSYIAMELVAGRTLRDVLTDGPLPIRRFIAIAAQIADGLARAHDAGIVHRDLKPENVMVTREGVAKILDFGLAKLVDDPGHSQLATVSQTSPGLVQGTVAYMSPEQASGTAVDSRSDQFSLGAVLYEMATAKRPFSRNTTAETLAAVIRDEPAPIQSQAPDCPLQLRWIIERCLAKDPDERYASTRDLARDLAQLRDHISQASQRVSVAAPSSGRRFGGWTRAVPWTAAAAFAAIAAFALLRTRPEPATRLLRFTISLPAGVTYTPSEISRAFAISPDGTRIVIEGVSNRRSHLYLRPLDSDRATELEGSIDATSPFWSPDARSLAFFANGKLKKIPATGGQPQDLCVATFALFGTWGPDGSILFSRFDPLGIYRVPDTGGEPQRIVVPDSTTARAGLDLAAVPGGRPAISLYRQPPSCDSGRSIRRKLKRLALSPLAWSTWHPGICCMGETALFSCNPSTSATVGFTVKHVSSLPTFSISSAPASPLSPPRKMASSLTRLAFLPRGSLGLPATVGRQGNSATRPSCEGSEYRRTGRTSRWTFATIGSAAPTSGLRTSRVVHSRAYIPIPRTSPASLVGRRVKGDLPFGSVWSA